jgi:hypothetical protein
LFSLASRLPFLLTAAIIAAAVGDSLVETIANGGAFGRAYHDNNHSSIVPALVAATVITLVVLLTRCVGLVRKSTHRPLTPSGAHGRRPARYAAVIDLSIVLPMQFGTLFVMESAEQLTGGGKLLGGLAWLGGPIAFSLVTHAVLGTLCAFAVAALARSILSRVASFVRKTLDAILFALTRGAKRPFVRRCDHASPNRAQAPHARQIGGRAPPNLPVAA